MQRIFWRAAARPGLPADGLRLTLFYANIIPVAGIAKWSNASDCKSAGFGLRRFDSYSQHHVAIHEKPPGIIRAVFSWGLLFSLEWRLAGKPDKNVSQFLTPGKLLWRPRQVFACQLIALGQRSQLIISR